MLAPGAFASFSWLIPSAMRRVRAADMNIDGTWAFVLAMVIPFRVIGSPRVLSLIFATIQSTVSARVSTVGVGFRHASGINNDLPRVPDKPAALTRRLRVGCTAPGHRKSPAVKRG